MTKIFPLALHLGVGFQLRIRLGRLISIFDIIWYQVLKQKRIHTLVLIFRLDSHQKEINPVILPLKTF